MSKTSDPELETDDNPQEEIIEIEGDSLEAITEEKSLVISEDIFPDSLLIVPLYDRPLFPKMLLPVIISDEKLENVLEDELKGPLKYVGLVYSYEPDVQNDETEAENIPDRLANIGAVGRIVQASKHGNDPMHIIVQVMERFEIIEIIA